MKTNFILLSLVISLSVALGLLGKIIYDRKELTKVNSALNEQLMQARLEIGRANTKFGDASSYANDLEKELDKELKERKAEITRYGELKARYTALEKAKGTGEIIYVYNSETNGFNLKKGYLYSAIDEKTLVEVNEIYNEYNDFRLSASFKLIPDPNKTPEIPFDFDYELNLTFRAELIETILPSGAINNYFNMWELDDKGNEITKLTITDYVTIVNDQRYNRFWFTPQLDIGVIGGFEGKEGYVMGGSIGFSFAGYGLSKNDLSWKFPKLSFDIIKKPGIGVTIAQYNLGMHLPFVSNLYIGPTITWFPNKKYFFGFSLSTSL